MTIDAITRYHDLLATGECAGNTHEQIERLQELRGLQFEDRPVCPVLRPRFLTLEQFRFIRSQVQTLLPAFQATHDRALADPGFRSQFQLREWEERLLEVDPGFPTPYPTSRLDAFYSGERDLWLTGYNTETPPGAGYSDSLTEAFYGLPVFQEFQRNYHVYPLPARPGVLHALLDSYARWRGNRTELPRVAILDWREVPTFSEFVILYDYFKGMGIEARNVDPRDVEYRDGKLLAGDFHITLVYKRVLISELIERGGLDHPVVRAVRDGAACMVNSFRCKILYKNAALAVVSDERNADLYTADQHRAIAAHIPWTRVVEDRTTQYEGQPVDLVPFVLASRDRLVLKANESPDGASILIGKSVDQPTWQRAVEAALATPHVVQQRVDLPTEPYPVLQNGRLEVYDRVQDTNAYVAFGSYVHGLLSRVSSSALVHDTAGEGPTVPTFLIEDR